MAITIAKESLRRISSEEVIQFLSVEGVIKSGYLPDRQVWIVDKISVEDANDLQKPRVMNGKEEWIEF